MFIHNFNDGEIWFLIAYKYLTLFLTNFKALLSLPILSNSIHRFSYGANPTTSRTRSRMNFTLLLPTWKNNVYYIVKSIYQCKSRISTPSLLFRSIKNYEHQISMVKVKKKKKTIFSALISWTLFIIGSWVSYWKMHHL